MFDHHTTALLRTVLDEVCRSMSRYETGTRTHVAAKILEAVKQGDATVDSLRQVGRKALNEAPTLWR